MAHRVTQPARFERARCNVARFLYRFDHSAANLVPRDHPWRVLVESAHEDLAYLTGAALHPRPAPPPPSLSEPSLDTR